MNGYFGTKFADILNVIYLIPFGKEVIIILRD